MYKKLNPDYTRNIIFGAEDSLVSTVGVLFGLASSSQFSSAQLILSGVTLIAVEALSMGAGSYLTETEVHELDTEKKHKDSTLLDGLLMFFSYIFFGLVALLPYFIFDANSARFISLFITAIFLFFVGYIPTRKFKSGLRTFVIAGIATAFGFLVANAF